MYNGNYEVASLVYIYYVYVGSRTIFFPVFLTLFSYNMFLAKYYLDIYLDLFWLKFFKKLQLSRVQATYFQKHRLVQEFLDLNFNWFKLMCNRTSHAMMAGGL